MFQPHHQPDPRVPGYGLSFELGEEDGHRTVGHGGVLSGFLTQMTLAPDDGVGVIVLANTGGLDGRGAPETLTATLLRRLLGLPDQTIRTDVPPRPEIWAELCGWYGMAPGPLTNAFYRLAFGAGVEVAVRHGHLMLLPISPIPALRRGFRLHPDHDTDPYVFRVDLATTWGKGTHRVAFRQEESEGSATMCLEGMGLSLRKRPGGPQPPPMGDGRPRDRRERSGAAARPDRPRRKPAMSQTADVPPGWSDPTPDRQSQIRWFAERVHRRRRHRGPGRDAVGGSAPRREDPGHAVVARS
jgi:hypothetical protein